MKSGFNGTKQIVAVPGNALVPIPLLATGLARYVTIVEAQRTPADAANPPQGFEYFLPNDTTANGFSEPFGVAPYTVAEIGDSMAKTSKHGSTLGNGPGVLIGLGPTPATTLCLLRSMSATATYVEVTQYYGG